MPIEATATAVDAIHARPCDFSDIVTKKLFSLYHGCLVEHEFDIIDNGLAVRNNAGALAPWDQPGQQTAVVQDHESGAFGRVRSLYEAPHELWPILPPGAFYVRNEALDAPGRYRRCIWPNARTGLDTQPIGCTAATRPGGSDQQAAWSLAAKEVVPPLLKLYHTNLGSSGCSAGGRAHLLPDCVVVHKASGSGASTSSNAPLEGGDSTALPERGVQRLHVQSLASSTPSSKDKNYPERPKRVGFFQPGYVDYTDGHCIDHADSKKWPPASSKQWASSCSSTTDLDNFIPEPYMTKWGYNARNTIVGRLRDNLPQCYAQYPIYDLSGTSTTGRCKKGVFASVLVPAGVWFYTFKPAGDAHLPGTMGDALEVPWPCRYHSLTEEFWRARIVPSSEAPVVDAALSLFPLSVPAASANQGPDAASTQWPGCFVPSPIVLDGLEIDSVLSAYQEQLQAASSVKDSVEDEDAELQKLRQGLGNCTAPWARRLHHLRHACTLEFCSLAAHARLITLLDSLPGPPNGVEIQAALCRMVLIGWAVMEARGELRTQEEREAHLPKSACEEVTRRLPTVRVTISNTIQEQAPVSLSNLVLEVAAQGEEAGSHLARCWSWTGPDGWEGQPWTLGEVWQRVMEATWDGDWKDEQGEGAAASLNNQAADPPVGDTVSRTLLRELQDLLGRFGNLSTAPTDAKTTEAAELQRPDGQDAHAILQAVPERAATPMRGVSTGAQGNSFAWEPPLYGNGGGRAAQHASISENPQASGPATQRAAPVAWAPAADVTPTRQPPPIEHHHQTASLPRSTTTLPVPPGLPAYNCNEWGSNMLFRALRDCGATSTLAAFGSKPYELYRVLNAMAKAAVDKALVEHCTARKQKWVDSGTEVVVAARAGGSAGLYIHASDIHVGQPTADGSWRKVYVDVRSPVVQQLLQEAARAFRWRGRPELALMAEPGGARMSVMAKSGLGAVWSDWQPCDLS